jgi:hypothetical protein
VVLYSWCVLLCSLYAIYDLYSSTHLLYLRYKRHEIYVLTLTHLVCFVLGFRTSQEFRDFLQLFWLLGRKQLPFWHFGNKTGLYKLKFNFKYFLYNRLHYSQYQQRYYYPHHSQTHCSFSSQKTTSSKYQLSTSSSPSKHPRHNAISSAISTSSFILPKSFPKCPNQQYTLA